LNQRHGTPRDRSSLLAFRPARMVRPATLSWFNLRAALLHEGVSPATLPRVTDPEACPGRRPSEQREVLPFQGSPRNRTSACRFPRLRRCRWPLQLRPVKEIAHPRSAVVDPGATQRHDQGIRSALGRSRYQCALNRSAPCPVR
jgi:hypothetical protein